MRPQVNIIGGLILVLLILFLIPFTCAFGGKTHDYIADEAGEVWKLIPKEIENNLGQPENSIDYFGDYQDGDNIRNGVVEEDQIGRPVYHFWEPDNPNFIHSDYDDGLLAFSSSWNRALVMWNEQVVPLYLEGKVDESYYWMGRVAHLLEDATVPAHTHLDPHLPIDDQADLLEEWAGEPTNYNNYSGGSYNGQEYKYNNLISGFNWGSIDPTNPLAKQNIELFRLFWYSAQKTQYWASNDEDGNTIYKEIDGDTQNWQCSGSGSLNLWASEGYTSCSQFIDDNSELNESNVQSIANAVIPHSMKVTASLYTLFEDAVHTDWATFQNNNRRTSYTILKGDVDTDDSYIVWESNGNEGTDFFDSPTIAEIKGGVDEGLELIVGTENAEGTEGRVYALDGRTNTQLWSFDSSSATHTVVTNDLDGDGKKEVVVTDRNGITWVLDATNGNEKWHYSPNTGNGAFVSAVENIDNSNEDDLKKEIFFTDFNETTYYNGETYMPAKVKAYALDYNGRLKWFSQKIDNGAQTESAIANLDSDPYSEIVISTFRKVYVFNGEDGSIKWDKAINTGFGAPTIADVDNDGQYEIIATSADSPYNSCYNIYSDCYNAVYVLDSNGNIEWSQIVDYGIYNSAAVANLDSDANLEIVVTTNDGPDFHDYRNTSIGKGSVYVFDGDTGSQQWRFQVGAKMFSSPAIADIDGDGEIEIVVGAYDGLVHVLDQSGNQEWTFNVGSYIVGSPALGDLDGDGALEIAVKHANGTGEGITNISGGGLRGEEIIDLTNNETGDGDGNETPVGDHSTLALLGGTNNPPILNNITNKTSFIGDLINLNSSGEIFATDPDNDTITFYYSSPFNSSGLWQTTVNDSRIYSILVEASDGFLSDSQIVFVEVIDNRSPTNFVVISPNGGEDFNASSLINVTWTQSNDYAGDYIAYNLQYSNNSGTSWYNIISNYGYENKLNDSSNQTSLTFTGNQNKTIYLRLPKNSKVNSARLDLAGALL